MFQSDNINELITALAKAQGEISPAIKENTNPHFKSKYADLNSFWNACRAPLSRHGLAVIQTMGQGDNGQLQLITTLAHSSGQWIRSILPIITQKNDAQGIGSALTYMRRYSLSAIVGISSDEDDDGEQAMGRGDQNKKSQPKPKQETISKEQANDLASILTDCSFEYQAQVASFLKKSNIEDLIQLPTILHEKLRNAALNKRDEYQRSLEVEEAVANEA